MKPQESDSTCREIRSWEDEALLPGRKFCPVCNPQGIYKWGLDTCPRCHGYSSLPLIEQEDQKL